MNTMVELAALILPLLASSHAWSVEIQFTGNPPLPVANLVRNPGIESGLGATPEGWSFATATPDNFETGWRDDGRSGKCLWLKAKTGAMSGYWGQVVPVAPGKSYLFKGYYRLGGGKILCYAHSSVALPDGRKAGIDERFYRGTMRGHWLVPVFLSPDSLGGPDPQQWYPFRLVARIPDPMQAVALSLGMYFTAGDSAFDDLWAGEAETELALTVKAAEGETLRRVVVTQVGSAKPVLDSQPLAAGSGAYEAKLEHQPTDAVHEVAVTLGNGEIVKARYPDVQEAK
ncbi:MAG: hypothetical protein GW911_04410 [Armatimonadetes bacterium]|nr:hypothetical protein [Armatimonadota bacterium]NDK11283.1 hypothetical protein [Armatimonadota bacterium]